MGNCPRLPDRSPSSRPEMPQNEAESTAQRAALLSIPVPFSATVSESSEVAEGKGRSACDPDPLGPSDGLRPSVCLRVANGGRGAQHVMPASEVHTYVTLSTSKSR
jgi:hypothetical protein